MSGNIYAYLVEYVPVNIKTFQIKIMNTPGPCFMHFRFTTPLQFIPLLNLRSRRPHAQALLPNLRKTAVMNKKSSKIFSQ